MKLVTFRLSFIGFGITIAGKIADLCAASLFLHALVSICLPVNASHLATTTLQGLRRVVSVEDLNSDWFHLPGGPLPTLKTRGNNKGLK